MRILSLFSAPFLLDSAAISIEVHMYFYCTSNFVICMSVVSILQILSVSLDSLSITLINSTLLSFWITY